MKNAFLIPTKIAKAAEVVLYILKMENAALVRKAARELFVQAKNLRFEENIIYKDYIELLRNTIEKFRWRFIDWVAGFDVWDYTKDSYDLYNSPGVNAHDKDPGEDIPFDPNDFFDDI